MTKRVRSMSQTMARIMRVSAGLLLLSVTFSVGGAAQQSVPALVQFSGQLKDQDGKPLNGVQGVTFALYKDQSGGASLWMETQNVTADSEGRFMALLGASSEKGLPIDLFSTGHAQWLGVQAAGYAEQPRSFLTSVPYALATPGALSSNNKMPDSSKYAATGTVNAGPPSPPIFTIATDATSGLQNTNDGAGTVTLSLIKSCSTGQLLKWNGTAWGCTKDTDVNINVTGGGLRVLANATSPNIIAGSSENVVTVGVVAATISGGGARGMSTNAVTDDGGTVGGGFGNQAGNSVGSTSDSRSATVGGGFRNFAAGAEATVGGGTTNIASGRDATVGGGQVNTASGQDATVAGGSHNTASGQGATVPGGQLNEATGKSSFAAGSGAHAIHDGTFVWRDVSGNGFESSGVNQFLIRATGGVGINTNSPAPGTLDVNGNVKATKFIGDGSLLTNLPGGGGGGGVSQVNTGTGLTGGPITATGTISVDTNVIQNRVAGACFTGFAIRVVNANGTVSCEPVVGGVAGSGTSTKLPRFNGPTTLGDSQISDNGVDVTIDVAGGGLKVLANGATPNIVAGYGSNAVTAGVNGATISGGGESSNENRVTDSGGSIGGGRKNQAGNNDATPNNTEFATVAGGEGNTASGQQATVSGGASNTASGQQATVGGGGSNIASGRWATVGGGITNMATQLYATVGGGENNIVGGQDATIPGGAFNEAAGVRSFAAGFKAKAMNTGTFVWGDSTNSDFASTGNDQFLIRATGGVGIGTNAPSAALDVNGNVKALGVTIPTGAAAGKVLTSDTNGNGTWSIPTGGIGGLGTASKLSRFTGPTTLGDSQISDDGTNVVINVRGGVLKVLAAGNGANIVAGSGGNSVTSTATGATISGGGDFGGNRVTDNGGTVGGGSNNRAGDNDAFTDNREFATVGGGINNTANGQYATVSGGNSNTADRNAATVSGGEVNKATGTAATVGGGEGNTASAMAATIGGGDGNIADGSAAMVPGGSQNHAAGSRSFAAGFKAKAMNDGSFVWSDSSSADFASTGNNQFLIRAAGGVGIGTNAPSAALDVNGNVKAGKFIGDGSMLTNLPVGTGGVTQVNTGAGLTGGPITSTGTVSVDTSVIQTRVSGTCAAGSAIQTVNANGSVDCQSLVGGGVGGSGTPFAVPRFTSPTTVGDSHILDDGTNVTISVTAGGLKVLATGGSTPNIIAGSSSNAVVSGVVGGTITGGGQPGGANRVTDNGGTVGGGLNNQAGDNDLSPTNSFATVSGGIDNTASGANATVGGGSHNTAGGLEATVGGGRNNTASGQDATVPGGVNNQASGPLSFAAGSSAKAIHPGAFVWADSAGTDLISTADNQFLIRAAGGVGIGTNNPAAALDVNGKVKASALMIPTGAGPGKILTSDLDGNGTWVAPIAGGVTRIDTGIGLTGGPITGTGSISIALNGVVNGMLQNDSLTVSAGLGLSGGGPIELGSSTTLSVDTTVIQNRVSSSCATGSAIRAVNQNGTVSCESVAGGGIDGTGSTTKLARFTGTTTLGDSQISDNGTDVTINVAGGALMVQASTFGPNAAPNIIAGYSGNVLSSGLSGATISGGGNGLEPNSVRTRWSTVAGGSANKAGDENFSAEGYATVSGGNNNIATRLAATASGGTFNSATNQYATVSGGQGNFATGAHSTVSGGNGNTASGQWSTVVGGRSNRAPGIGSLAAGNFAVAQHDGTFVWGDGTGPGLATSSGPNSFTARATGGVRFISAVNPATGIESGVALAPGGGGWLSFSDRNAKENFGEVDGVALLKKLNAIPVQTWNYKSQDASTRHIGPMAQDFHAAFGLGEDEKHINTVDADGVALAGVQTLYRLILEKDVQLENQQKELHDLRSEMNQLQADLKEALQQLRALRNEAPKP